MKILKFDSIHPLDCLKDIQESSNSLEQMSRVEYLEKLINTRINYSDFYTYNLGKCGWSGEEFFMNDPVYLEKVAKELYSSRYLGKIIQENIKDKIRPVNNRWKKRVISDYIHEYKPDVIFVREYSEIESIFWYNKFRKKCLLVNRIAAPVSEIWNPRCWDLIYTSTEIYKSFFQLQNVNSIINPNGFDERVLKELPETNKARNLVFIGGLGGPFFKQRTAIIKEISAEVDLEWWGYGREFIDSKTRLFSSWKGLAAGMKMFSITKESRIALNDYIDIASGSAVNQRIFEVLGIGTFLLTRESKNLKKDFPKDIFVTYQQTKDCVDKIKYFLKNENEREEIAQCGQKFILENYSYSKLMKVMGQQLESAYEAKFRP